MNVLFLNHKIKECGVYQYGLRLFEILKKSEKFNYIYNEIDNYEEYFNLINSNKYVAIFYNYHFMTMNWLTSNNISSNILNIGTQHDLQEYHFFHITVRLDTTLKEIMPNKYNIPRPIYENVDEILSKYKGVSDEFNKMVEYKEDNVPIFGSFGFARTGKGFDKIISLINDNFDNAIIKFLIPKARFLDSNLVSHIMNECFSIYRKKGIKLLITNEFVENEDILYFLKSNSMNIFMYDNSFPNSGVSSVIDYAISVKRPIAISDSHWFRHIYNDEICLSKRNINYIYENSVQYINKITEQFSNQNLINKIEGIISNNIIQN